MYKVKLEDHVLRELHRAAVEAGRRGISVPSADLDAIARRTGTRQAARRAIQRLANAERIVRIRKDLLLLPDSTGLLGVNLGVKQAIPGVGGEFQGWYVLLRRRWRVGGVDGRIEP